MSDTEALVYVDLAWVPTLVGRLWSRARKGRESATFEYDKTWLEHPECFALEPALTLGAGPQHTEAGKALFGALGDSAPDRWGRVLMQRAERKTAQPQGRAARAPREIDFLLMVDDDETRQGAFCILILQLASSPLIQGGSRMRKSARTDLCGGRSVMIVPTASIRRQKMFCGSCVRLYSLQHAPRLRHASRSL
jgi:hypothetical protein